MSSLFILSHLSAARMRISPIMREKIFSKTSTGAKSGQRRINPLAYLPDGDRLIIFATKGGASTNPDWYYNLLAHPEATVEVGTEKFEVTASVVQGAERDQLYTRQVAVTPAFGDYEKKTPARFR